MGWRCRNPIFILASAQKLRLCTYRGPLEAENCHIVIRRMRITGCQVSIRVTFKVTLTDGGLNGGRVTIFRHHISVEMQTQQTDETSTTPAVPQENSSHPVYLHTTFLCQHMSTLTRQSPCQDRPRRSI